MILRHVKPHLLSFAWARSVHYFPYYSKCTVWKIQYSGWQIQDGGQSRGVKNLIKGGITIDCVNNTTVNNSKRGDFLSFHGNIILHNQRERKSKPPNNTY